MKKLLALIVAFCLIMPTVGCSAAGGNGITRGEAAAIIAEKTGFTGGSAEASDVKSSDSNRAAITACISRDIFGEPTLSYRFRPKDKLTRYELAKVSVYTLAALLGVEDENLEPGLPNSITDISKLSVQQRWYVNAALSYGFMSAENGKFKPDAVVEKAELNTVIDKVVEKAGKTGTDYETYSAAKLTNFNTFPSVGGAPSDKIDIYNVASVSDAGQRLCAATLQGLVNRSGATLYLDYGGYAWMTDYAIEKEYYSGYAEKLDPGDINGLINRYKDSFDTAVVFDPEKPFSINTCVNLAAVYGGIVISPAMVQSVLTINPGTDIITFSDLNLSTQFDSLKWEYENLFEYMRRDVICWPYYSRQDDFERDYPVQLKVPTMWVPGTNSPDYDRDCMLYAADILMQYPANIPMLGFGYAHDPEYNGNVGLGEFDAVKLHGEYGKYTAVFDTVGNLSFHTALKVPDELKKFTPKEKPKVTYQPDKKYVAITMTESGDSPAYIQYGLMDRQWRHESRGKVPYNFSYGLNNYDLYPLLTSYWFETAGTYDYFFGAISGLGYSYPMIGFGDKGVRNEEGVYMDKEDIMRDHYTKTNEMCKRLGFDSMGVYSFPEGTWNEYNYEDFDNWVLQYMPDVKTIIADMHRGVYQLEKDQLMHVSDYGQRIYHCSTKWSLSDFGGDRERLNGYLYDEILRTTSNGGTFFQCMAYSWHYGPDDIKAVIDRFAALHPEYVFVTVDVLDDVYLQSVGA